MAVTIDGNLGITTPGLTNTGTEILVDLTTTGNTVIGNSTLDTLTVGVTGIVKDTLGNVGIGTASPAAKLDVRGSSTFLVNATNPTAWVSVDSALTTGSIYNQWNTTTNEGIFGSYTNHPIYFVTNNTRRLTIDTSGNVGIGGSNDTLYGKFEVLGTGYQAMAVKSTDASGVVLAAAANSSNEARFLTVSNHPMWFGTNNTERMRIDSSGNVGIGTTPPVSAYRLSVAGNGLGMALQDTGSVGTWLDFKTGSGTVQGNIYYNFTSGYMVFGTAASGSSQSEKMRIDASGNLLVGTTSASVPSTTGFISTANTFGYKNRIINGNFDIWQRGTTNTLTVYGYTVADRWQYVTDGTLNSGTVFSQQAFTVGQTAVPNNPKYYLQIAYTSVNTPSNYIRQRIENVATLSGQTATFSFWAKVSSGTLSISCQFQQEFGSGGSPSSGVYGIGATSFTATTTWQQFTMTTAVPSISGKTIGSNNDSALNAAISFPTSGTATVQIAQVQVEQGPIATSFDVRFLGTELAMCQRYFVQYGGNAYTSIAVGDWFSGTRMLCLVQLPAPMRTTPTPTNNGFVSWYGGNPYGVPTTGPSVGNVSNQGGSVIAVELDMTTSTATATSGGAGLFKANNNASATFSLSAEL